MAQRLGRVLESDDAPERSPAGNPRIRFLATGQGVRESAPAFRIRIQIIRTVLILISNLVSVAVAVLMVTVTLPAPNMLDESARWITFIVTPVYVAAALAVGTSASAGSSSARRRTC